MHLVIKSNLFAILLFSISSLTAQIKIGLALGTNYDFGKNISESKNSNGTATIIANYNNKSFLTPSFSIIFSEIPLAYTEQIVVNQRAFKTVISNNSTSFALGLESNIKNHKKFNLSGKLGFGITTLQKPLILTGNSNESFGYYTDYTDNSEKNFAFLDLTGKIDRNFSKKRTAFLSIGTQYYPKNTSVSFTTNYTNQNLEINTSFTKIRPYFNFGIEYSFEKSN
jgi:hypothetical protein